MAETVDELTVSYIEDGVEKVKELDKQVLSKGAWATVAFLYQDLDPRSGKYSDPKVTLRRYKKVKGQYLQQSRFNISSASQAEQISKILAKWFTNEEASKEGKD